MPRRRIGRFVIEVLFLAGAAAALTVADFRPAAVIAGMLVAWAIVALIEWAAWLDEPHYGRGLPPRYYVPQVALPPPRPVDQLARGYPIPILEPDDEQTFVASTQEWAAALEDWPVLDVPVGEDTEIVIIDEVELAEEVELIEDEPPPAPVHLPPVIELELEEALEAEPEEEALELVDELPEELTLQGLVVEDPDVEASPPERIAPPAAPEQAGDEPEPEPAPAQRRKQTPQPAAQPRAVAPVLAERIATRATHRIDPLSEGSRRLWSRRPSSEGVIELADGPPEGRALPSRLRSQRKAKSR
jgi:hypothetical protein